MECRLCAVPGFWKIALYASVFWIPALSTCQEMQEQVVLDASPKGLSKRPQPLSLKITYEVKERYAQAGGGSDFLRCDFAFKITNTMPLPIRFAFPPVGVFFGGQVPFAKADADNEDIPEFARKSQIVELRPGETKTFTSKGHVISGLPAQFEWVFGKPSHGPIPANLVVGSVYSTPRPITKEEPAAPGTTSHSGK